MKKNTLILLILLSLLSFTHSMAQTPPAAAPVSDADAQFLATLADGQAQTPGDLAPAPTFMAGCSSNAECPSGQLCCNVCGNPPLTESEPTCKACVKPIRGRCPLIV